MVDSMIGKLQAILADTGRGSEWHPLLEEGNPAACQSVKMYLANVREEQLKARVTPHQADPILVEDLALISNHIEHMLLHKANSAIQMFVHARDQALFKALFFADDRGADLLLTKVSDILRLPDDSGFLFNHLWTKSLRSGDANVFAFKRGSNKTLCPVRGLEVYVSVCKLIGIKLTPGFHFRPVTKSNRVSSQSLGSSAAQARLSFYTSSLKEQLSGEHLTIHGFRSGTAVRHVGHLVTIFRGEIRDFFPEK